MEAAVAVQLYMYVKYIWKPIKQPAETCSVKATKAYLARMLIGWRQATAAK